MVPTPTPHTPQHTRPNTHTPHTPHTHPTHATHTPITHAPYNFDQNPKLQLETKYLQNKRNSEIRFARILVFFVSKYFFLFKSSLNRPRIKPFQNWLTINLTKLGSRSARSSKFFARFEMSQSDCRLAIIFEQASISPFLPSSATVAISL